jgi:hypothetical protein
VNRLENCKSEINSIRLNRKPRFVLKRTVIGEFDDEGDDEGIEDEEDEGEATAAVAAVDALHK